MRQCRGRRTLVLVFVLCERDAAWKLESHTDIQPPWALRVQADAKSGGEPPLSLSALLQWLLSPVPRRAGLPGFWPPSAAAFPNCQDYWQRVPHTSIVGAKGFDEPMSRGQSWE